MVSTAFRQHWCPWDPAYQQLPMQKEADGVISYNNWTLMQNTKKKSQRTISWSNKTTRDIQIKPKIKWEPNVEHKIPY